MVTLDRVWYVILHTIFLNSKNQSDHWYSFSQYIFQELIHSHQPSTRMNECMYMYVYVCINVCTYVWMNEWRDCIFIHVPLVLLVQCQYLSYEWEMEENYETLSYLLQSKQCFKTTFSDNNILPSVDQHPQLFLQPFY